MKKAYKKMAVFTVLAVISCFLFTNNSLAGGNSKLAVGWRTHVAHSDFTALPFEDGDTSYALAYEYHNPKAYWQFAVDYASDLSGTNNVDTVITPSLSLIAKDSLWQGGTGILMSRIDGPDSEEWTDIYWQLIFGINVPMGGLNINFLANYVFENWSDLSSPNLGEAEYGIWAKIAF